MRKNIHLPIKFGVRQESVCANISEAWAKKNLYKALCKQAMHSVAEGFHSASVRSKAGRRRRFIDPPVSA